MFLWGAQRVFGKNFQEQVEEWLSFCETGDSPQKTLEVTKEAPVQSEKEAAEMTKKLEKQEKKRLLQKKKKCLAANALTPVPSENIRSSPGGCEKIFKEENTKASGESSGEWNGRPTSLFIQTLEKEMFFQGAGG